MPEPEKIENLKPEVPAPDSSKDEQVGDTARALDVEGFGTVYVFSSVNGTRYYIAPQFSFELLDEPVIARASRLEAAGKVECQFRLRMVVPDVRKSVAQQLYTVDNKKVPLQNIGNLAIFHINFDLKSDDIKREFGIMPYVLSLPEYGQKLDISLSINKDKATQFVQGVNNGDVTFKISYIYKNINIDNRIEKLDISYIRNSNTFRNLDQQGKDLMSAEQAAQAMDQITREITSKVVEGLGKIEPASLPVEKLLSLFAVPETTKQDEQNLALLDDKIRNQFNLNVNPKDFQPFRVQKHVVESLNTEQDVQTQRTKYASLYKNDQKRFDVSGSYGIGPFSAKAGYSQDVQKVENNSEMSDDQFRNFLKSYHGAEYDTEERLYRGVKIYDKQQFESRANTAIISVTYKPVLSQGERNVLITPSLRQVKQPTPASSNAPRSFYINYMENAEDRHNFYQIGDGKWIEQFPNGISKVFSLNEKYTIDNTDGIIIKALEEDLYLFIPNRNAGGRYPNWMRHRRGSDGEWRFFQQMLNIE